MFAKNAAYHMKIKFGRKNVKISVLNIMPVPLRLLATPFKQIKHQVTKVFKNLSV